MIVLNKNVSHGSPAVIREHGKPPYRLAKRDIHFSIFTHETTHLEITIRYIKLLSKIALRCASRYNSLMIKSFKHKGLKKYFETGSSSGIQPKHQRRLRMQLTAIDTAQVIEDIDLPGFQLHGLKGNRDGIWSISVNGNWRITFEFIDGNAFILNYEDYH